MRPGPAQLLLTSLLIFAASPLHAAPSITTEHATVTLLSEQSGADSGGNLWVALHFELIPHWHVYWRNPGASGTAPVIRWILPEGWEAGQIRWPVPKRIRVGPLTNYGYEERVTFMVPLRAPEGPPPQGPLKITAEVGWLVCREECIPEEGRLTLSLNEQRRDPDGSPDIAAVFSRARARWPEPGILTGRYRLEGDALAVSVDAPVLSAGAVGDVWLAADRWGPIAASGAQEWRRTQSGLALEVPAGDLPPVGGSPLEGLLVMEHGAAPGSHQGYRVRLAAPPPGLRGSPGLTLALGFALLGGLVLNVMPCVLPVLGIKVLGFVNEAREDRRRLALHGWLYGAGVLLSFVVLAAGLLILRAGGESLGWGFQLQSPPLVGLLAYLMLLIGLNLSGVFSVGDGWMGVGQPLARHGGLGGSFATGVLAAVVASPCTAPFMGAALGFAVTRPAWEALAVFAALGVGFALPVVLLSLWPAWVRVIPRPGAWMSRFRELLAFPLYATSAWLLWVLSQQVDASAYGAALAGLVGVGLAAWLYGQWRPRGWRLALTGIGLAGVLAMATRPLAVAEPPASADERPLGQPWSEQRVRELIDEGRPVLVNFTAAWCITCEVNEQVALGTDKTRSLFESRSLAYLVADWTRRDPAITRQLERYGRSGVPLYLLYAPGLEQPRVLPQLLTEGIVAEAVEAL